jgi:transposase-like protein
MKMMKQSPGSAPAAGVTLTSRPGRARRRKLAPSQKYEVFTSVLTSSATQRELAEKYGVDRTTIRSICATAKQGALDALAAAVPGRRGKTVVEVELDDARAEIERLKATVLEQAVALHLERGKERWD